MLVTQTVENDDKYVKIAKEVGTKSKIHYVGGGIYVAISGSCEIGKDILASIRVEVEVEGTSNPTVKDKADSVKNICMRVFIEKISEYRKTAPKSLGGVHGQIFLARVVADAVRFGIALVGLDGVVPRIYQMISAFDCEKDEGFITNIRYHRQMFAIMGSVMSFAREGFHNYCLKNNLIDKEVAMAQIFSLFLR